jgi:Pyruvate/2-oxoacid:ferredoxin oxidoreductase gamma subunit/ferredoxin
MFLRAGRGRHGRRQQELDQDHRRRSRLLRPGYFVYDSKKSGSQTVSHLRFGPDPIRSPYLVQSANFIGCHQFNFLDRGDVLKTPRRAATFLLNTSPHEPEEVWERIPRPVQEEIIAKKLKVYGINAEKVARDNGMGTRINTIMQTCFFAISGVLPRDKAIDKIKYSIKKTYMRKGEEVVRKNFEAVDNTLVNLREIPVPAQATSTRELPPTVPANAPEFVRNVTAMMMAGRGDELPVSALPVDGTYPSATTQWEKRNISNFVPVWEPDICIQCGNCSMVCPHGVIRSKFYNESSLESAPKGVQGPRPSTPGASRISATPCKSIWKTAPAAGCAWRSARPRARSRPGARPSTWRSRSRCWRTSAPISLLRDPAGSGSRPGGFLHGARGAVPAAAVRVLRRLRRLRRDPLRQAAVATVRRPAAGGQRHRLFLDLRRQPADHALVGQQRRARPGLVQLAVRGQRRIRFGLPPDRRQASGIRPELLQGAGWIRSVRIWWTI